jgi:hypothetical protein
MLRAGLSGLEHANPFFILPEVFVPDHSVDLGEQGIVFAAADVHAGMNACTPLAHENATGGYALTGETLDTETLGAAVAPVLDTALAFFVSHGNLSWFLFRERRDAELRELLPVPARPAVVLTTFLLENNNLTITTVAHDLGLDLLVFDEGLANGDALAIGDQKDLL